MILHCDSPQYDPNMRGTISQVWWGRLVKITAPAEATLKQKQVLWIKHKRWEAQVQPCCGKSTWGFPWKIQVALLVASPTIPFTTSRLGWMTSQNFCGFVCPHQRPFFCTFSSVVARKQRCSKFSGASSPNFFSFVRGTRLAFYGCVHIGLAKVIFPCQSHGALELWRESHHICILWKCSRVRRRKNCLRKMKPFCCQTHFSPTQQNVCDFHPAVYIF